MKVVHVMLVLMFVITLGACAQEQQPPAEKTLVQEAQVETAAALLLDDFEGAVTGGFDGSFDYGSGNGAQVELTASTDIKESGAQSIKVVYDAPADGYLWIARGFGLDASNTAWLVKNDQIDWSAYNAFSFHMYGSASGAQVAFDVKDSGNEMWRFMTTDDTEGWKQVIAPLSGFFARGDWQPDGADKNAQLDFPLKSFQFEPRPVSGGTLYFDKVELIKQEG